jgi:hypothetical protein
MCRHAITQESIVLEHSSLRAVACASTFSRGSHEGLKLASVGQKCHEALNK